MVSKPYEDEDDAPTLQRPLTPSGPAARFDSGVRAAVGGVPLDDLHDIGFEDEATTAVDRVPVISACDYAIENTVTSLDAAAAAGAVTLPPPADTETDTANLPVDVAAVLRRASEQTDPPPSPLGDPLDQTKLSSR